jgi:hypothetical protein
MEETLVRLGWHQCQGNLFINMNITDLTNIESNENEYISVLGFGEPSTSLEILRGMVKGSIAPRRFDIQIESETSRKFVPKAIDIVNETKNRFNINSKYTIVNKSVFNRNARIVIINSLLFTKDLLYQVFNSISPGTVIILPLYNTNNLVKKNIDEFLFELKIELSFSNSKEISYLIKGKTPYKELTVPEVIRTRSRMT